MALTKTDLIELLKVYDENKSIISRLLKEHPEVQEIRNFIESVEGETVDIAAQQELMDKLFGYEPKDKTATKVLVFGVFEKILECSADAIEEIFLYSAQKKQDLYVILSRFAEVGAQENVNAIIESDKQRMSIPAKIQVTIGDRDYEDNNDVDNYSFLLAPPYNERYIKSIAYILRCLHEAELLKNDDSGRANCRAISHLSPENVKHIIHILSHFPLPTASQNFVNLVELEQRQPLFNIITKDHGRDAIDIFKGITNLKSAGLLGEGAQKQSNFNAIIEYITNQNHNNYSISLTCQVMERLCYRAEDLRQEAFSNLIENGCIKLIEKNPYNHELRFSMLIKLGFKSGQLLDIIEKESKKQSASPKKDENDWDHAAEICLTVARLKKLMKLGCKSKSQGDQFSEAMCQLIGGDLLCESVIELITPVFDQFPKDLFDLMPFFDRLSKDKVESIKPCVIKFLTLCRPEWLPLVFAILSADTSLVLKDDNLSKVLLPLLHTMEKAISPEEQPKVIGLLTACAELFCKEGPEILIQELERVAAKSEIGWLMYDEESHALVQETSVSANNNALLSDNTSTLYKKTTSDNAPGSCAMNTIALKH